MTTTKKPSDITSLNISERLREAGIVPNKTLGQNFLVNAGIYEKIIAALELTSNDTVVEVGPGLGTLTDYLLNKGGRVVAIEKDPVLVEYLQKRYSEQNQIEIIHEDILRFDPIRYPLYPTRFKLVGNIPYYLTSHLFRVIFAIWPPPERMVFMIQKEVAQRIVAKPPEMSLLAVSIQYYATAEIIARVSAGSFLPVPNVDSAIIKLTPKKDVVTDELLTKRFFRIVKVGFAGKRKQLANNLASGLKLEKTAIIEKLSSVGIDPVRRAETLTLTEWQQITDHMDFLP